MTVKQILKFAMENNVDFENDDIFEIRNSSQIACELGITEKELKDVLDKVVIKFINCFSNMFKINEVFNGLQFGCFEIKKVSYSLDSINDNKAIVKIEPIINMDSYAMAYLDLLYEFLREKTKNSINLKCSEEKEIGKNIYLYFDLDKEHFLKNKINKVL